MYHSICSKDLPGIMLNMHMSAPNYWRPLLGCNNSAQTVRFKTVFNGSMAAPKGRAGQENEDYKS